MTVYAQPVYEYMLDGVTWTDMTSDVVEGTVSLKYGIDGNGPLDSVASTGECTGISLRNDARIGKPLGYYSPNNTSVRTGWTFGVPFRLRFLYAGVYYSRFRGKARIIIPDSGAYGRRQVSIVAYDVMRDLAETDVREIGIQVSKTESEVVTNVLASLPVGSQPVATDIDAGVDTFPYALDNLGDSTKALTVIADAARSAFALVACKGDGTFIMRSRHTRTLGMSTFSFSSDFIDVQVPSDLSSVYNLVRVTIHPKTIDAAATTVLFTLTGAVPSVSAGETVTLWGSYNDATNAQKLIGGIPRSGPLLVSGTDYAGNSAVDGSGSDLTSTLDVSASTAFATTAKFVVKNNGTSTIYLIASGGTGPKLQVRGKGVYDRGPQTYEASSTQAYGIRPISIDMPLQADPFVGQSAATYIEALWNDLSRQIKELKFCANDSGAKMLFALTVEPGDRLTITEPVTGLTAVDAMVQSVSFEIMEKVITCKLGLSLASIFQFWQWGIGNHSEWGLTTVYGF